MGDGLWVENSLQAPQKCVPCSSTEVMLACEGVETSSALSLMLRCSVFADNHIRYLTGDTRPKSEETRTVKE